MPCEQDVDTGGRTGRLRIVCLEPANRIRGPAGQTCALSSEILVRFTAKSGVFCDLEWSP